VAEVTLDPVTPGTASPSSIDETAHTDREKSVPRCNGEVNGMAEKKVAPKAPAAKASGKGSKDAATRVTKKVTARKVTARKVTAR
jgi:hypothetical protein